MFSKIYILSDIIDELLLILCVLIQIITILWLIKWMNDMMHIKIDKWMYQAM